MKPLVFLAALFAAGVAFAEEHEPKDVVCFSATLALSSSSTDCQPSQPRMFVRINPRRTDFALGPAELSDDDQRDRFGRVVLRFIPDLPKKWPAITTLTVMGGEQRWVLKLAPRDASTFKQLLLPAGVYDVAIDAEGFHPASVRAVVKAGKTFTIGSTALIARRFVRGWVVDGAGHPLAGARVRSMSGVAIATSDNAGRFRGSMPKLANDLAGVSVVIDAPSFAAVRLPLTEWSDDEIDLGEVRVGRGVDVTVHLHRACDAPCDTTLSVLERVTAPGSVRARTVASASAHEGEAVVRIPNVPPGSWFLSLRGGLPLQQRIMPLNVGGQPMEVEAAIESGHLTGLVRYGGEPVPAARIETHFGDEMLEGTIKTSDDGSFDEVFWQEGRYRVLVSGGPLVEPFDLMRGLHLETHQTWTIDIPDTEVTGRVYDADTNEPIAGVEVRDDMFGEYTRSGAAVVTDGEGRYRFQGVRRGSHELVVALANGYLPSEPVKLQIAGSERRAEANIALRRAAVGWFRVLGEDDRPVANVMVAMSDDAAGGSSMDAQPTDMEGVVSLPARFATQTRWASAVGTDGFGFVLLPTPLRGADDPIVIRLTRATAALHLNIRDEKGKAVPGAGVLMRLNGHALTQSVLMLAGYVQHFEPRSNDSGELYLGRWPAGAIEVWAYHDAAEKYDIMAGPRPKPATATIVPGENRLDVLLHSR